MINAGGTLAPGPMGTPGNMTVAGNLASSSTNVTGTASLAGTVVAKVTSATTKAYDILHSAGLGGATFAALVVNNNPNFLHFLSYSATDVFLNLTAQLGVGGSQNVSNALNNFFNSVGTLPPAFGSLFGLTGSNLANALDQVSGEAATGAQTAASSSPTSSST